MSAQSISCSAGNGPQFMAVSFRILLGLYAIIPLCLLAQLADRWWLDGYLLSRLPSSPSHFLLFQLLFGTPHILASSILLASNREYLQIYRNKLLAVSALIVLVFGIGSLFIPYRVLYVIAACWTVYHVLKQQHGVGKAVCRLPGWAFFTLLWLSVLAGILIYMGIFLKNSLEAEQVTWIKTLASSLTVMLVLASGYCQKWVPGTFGKYFLWSNTLLVVTSLYFYDQQYYFLAILVPRLVHDMTAYLFYISHDYNKHRPAPQNGLYRLAGRCRVPVVVVLPALSFLLTYLLQAYGDDWVNLITRTLFGTEVYKAVTLGVIGYLALMHYYTEAFIWTAGSPLRRYIRFVV